jgi:hypothetical protein
MIITKRVEMWVKQDSHVTLLHFGAAEQQAVRSAWSLTLLVGFTPGAVYARWL